MINIFKIFKKNKKNVLPPGYKIQVNKKGQYRACNYNGIPLFDYQSPHNTIEGAIMRAWRQYNYENPTIVEDWKDIKAND